MLLVEKNLSKQHTKGSRNQIGCAKYTVGRNRKYVFWCLGLLTNNHRDLLLGSFERSNPKYSLLFVSFFI